MVRPNTDFMAEMKGEIILKAGLKRKKAFAKDAKACCRGRLPQIFQSSLKPAYLTGVPTGKRHPMLWRTSPIK